MAKDAKKAAIKLKLGSKKNKGSEKADVACCVSEAQKNGLPEYDPQNAYSCIDERYIGKKKQVVVEFTALDLKVCDRCQGTDQRVMNAVERCRDVLAACGYDIRLETAIITNEWLAEQYRFYSSPTIRVNGVDICPSIEENDCGCCSDMSDSPIKCRLYPFNGTYYEVPPTDMIIQGIMDIVMHGKSADPTKKAYKLPKNLKMFFTGVRKKASENGEVNSEGCCNSGCC